MTAPVDAEGTKYRPGQQVAYAYLSGCIPIVVRRTVVAVRGGEVLVSPMWGESIPQAIKRPHRALIIQR